MEAKNVFSKGLCVLVLTFFSLGTHAQNYSEGNSQINFGIGLSSYYGSGTGYETSFPPIEIQYENFISDKISIGGFAGYASSSFESKALNFEFTTNFFMIGGLFNYHLYDDGKFNVYAGGKIGYVNVSYKTKDGDEIENDFFSDNFKEDGNIASGILFGAHIGGRYFFSENFAANAELGYGIALFRLGVSLKL